MQQPLDRRGCPQCCRHPAHFHQVPVDESDDENTASTMSTILEAGDVRKSDEDFIERDSEDWHSADDYQGCQAVSEGSSEHWEGNIEDDDNEHEEGNDNDTATAAIAVAAAATDHDDDDVRNDDDNGQDTPGPLGNSVTDPSQVLDGTSVCESPMASLSAVLRSLEANTGLAGNHARHARDGEAHTPKDPSCGTSK